LGNLRARSLGVGVRWVREVHRRQEAGDEGTQGINPFTKELTVFKAKPER
jgi:hypothetical protein